jgi:3-amino-5-hydroxybenzoate synthase
MDVSTKRFIDAIEAEGIPNQASYPPIHAMDLFQKDEYRKRLCPEQAVREHPFLEQQYPITQRAAWETVWIPQYALLGDEEDMHEIALAINKIQHNARDLL